MNDDPRKLLRFAAGAMIESFAYREMHGSFDWYPEFDKPLGPPRGAAIRTGWNYQREFAHASVSVNLVTKTARID